MMGCIGTPSCLAMLGQSMKALSTLETYLPMIIFHFYQKGKGLEGSEKLDVSAPLAAITPS